MLIFCYAGNISAQGIFWNSSCENRSICLNPNSCTQSNVFIVPEAVANCITPDLTYTYKIDFNNNSSVDIQVMNDTLNEVFPKGTHKVTWKVTDQCGHLSNCTYLVTVEDCQPPQLICSNVLTQQVNQPSCSLVFTAQQFISVLSDNCTPNNLIDIGIRIKNPNNMGFPTTDTLSFGTCDEGENFVEILVRDEVGLITQCNSRVIVQDLNNDCNCNLNADVAIAGCIKSSFNKRVNNCKVVANIQSTAGVNPPININYNQVTSDSCFNKTLATQLPLNAAYLANVKMERTDDPLNGVTTFDLVLMSKHILGIESFTSFYQVLAADVNNSASVTTFDIVEIRKMVLGIYPSLPSAPSWRFIRPIANIANLNNFAAVKDTYQLTIPMITDDLNWFGLNFIGIKSGDINGSAMGLTSGSSDGSYYHPPLGVRMITDDWAESGEERRIPMVLEEAQSLIGWQMSLKADHRLAEIIKVEGIPTENYHLKKETLRALWYDVDSKQFDAERPLIYVTIKVLQSGRISDMIGLETSGLSPEAYHSDGTTRSLVLKPLKEVTLIPVSLHNAHQSVPALR